MNATIVTPAGDNAFQVNSNEIVRLSASAMSGSTLEFKVEGPVKIARQNTIRVAAGDKSEVGVNSQEVEITPTGVGQARVIVISKLPGAKQEQAKVFSFEVI
jgi:hypothetical protein